MLFSFTYKTYKHEKADFYLFACVLLFYGASAQYEYNFYVGSSKYYALQTARQQQFRDSILKNKIAVATEYRKYYNSRGKLQRSALSNEKVFDNRGDLVTEISYDRKGRPEYIYKYGFEANGMQNSFMKYSAKGKFLRGWKITFNALGRAEKRENFIRNQNVAKWGQAYVYNSDTNLVRVNNFNKKGTIRYYLEREYYTDGKLKETRSYSKKGKLKSVLKYDCTPTGTLKNGNKADTTTFCTKSEVDADGNRIATYETIKQNGKVWRYITKTNKAGQLVEQKYVDNKGRVRYTMTHAYNANGRKIEETYTKKKNKGFKTQYEYSPLGQRLLTRTSSLKGEVWAETYTVLP